MGEIIHMKDHRKPLQVLVEVPLQPGSKVYVHATEREHPVHWIQNGRPVVVIDAAHTPLQPGTYERVTP